MEDREITLGQVTYAVSRIYTGERAAAELISEQLVRRIAEKPSFDERHIEAV